MLINTIARCLWWKDLNIISNTIEIKLNQMSYLNRTQNVCQEPKQSFIRWHLIYNLSWSTESTAVRSNHTEPGEKIVF